MSESIKQDENRKTKTNVKLNDSTRFQRNFKVFVQFFTVLLIIYCGFLRQNYNHDILGPALTFDGSFNIPIQSYLVGGRPISGTLRYFYDRFLGLFGIGYLNGQWVTELITIALLSFDASIIYLVIADNIETKAQRVLSFLCILIGFINPGFVELFSFYGPDIGFALLFASLALRAFSKGRNILSSLYVYLAVSCYQVYYAPFIIYSFVWIFIKGEHKRKYLQSIIVTGVGIIANLIITKASSAIFLLNEVKPTSIPVDQSIIDRIGWVIRTYRDFMKSSYGLLPPFLIISILGVLFIVVIISLLYKKDYKALPIIIFISMVIALVPISFGFIMSDFYYPHRATVPVYFAVGALIILAGTYLSRCDDNRKISQIISKFSQIGAITLLVALICAVEFEISDIFVLNNVEKQTCRSVKEQIIKYEKETGENIDTIKVAHIHHAVFYLLHENSAINYIIYQPNIAMLDVEWSDVVYLNYITGSNYKRENASQDDIRKHFSRCAEESLSHFNPFEHIAFEGSTMFWLLY